MKINDELLKVLRKTYEPSATLDLRFKKYDLRIKTDEEGNPILLFIGILNTKGLIKGDRFSRKLIKDAEGRVIKDHWDRKGPAS